MAEVEGGEGGMNETRKHPGSLTITQDIYTDTFMGYKSRTDGPRL